MISRVTHHLARAAIAAAVSFALAAQSLGAQLPRALSVDFTLGGGAGLGGGALVERGGVALDALLGRQISSADSRGRMIGVTAGVQGSLGSGDKCFIGPSGKCLGEFPALATIGVVAGKELRRRSDAAPGPTLRLLAGPAYVHVDNHSIGGERSTVGILGRADVASAPLGPLAAVLSLRGTLIPRVNGQTLGAWAIGVGGRLR